MNDNDKRVLAMIGENGGTLSTVDGLARQTKIDFLEVKRSVHRLIGMGSVRAHVTGTFGVTCYGLTEAGLGDYAKLLAVS